MSTLVPPSDGLATPRRYFALAVLFSTLALVVLDGAIANVALPTISESLRAEAADTVWVVSAYQIAVLVALLPCGALGEILGPRRVYLGGVALFTLASAACALAPSLSVLVAARFVQGLGGGAIMALNSMNLRFSVPQRMLGSIIGVNAMVVAISSAAGPGLAGAILAVADWRWLFAVNIPIGVVVLACSGALGRMPGLRRRVNVWVFLVNAAMFVLFFLGAEAVAGAPWSGVALLAGAFACLGGLLVLERASPAPIVPTDLLAQPAFRVAVIASVCFFTAQMLSYVALPFYLQHVLDMTPVQAGLYMMPWPAAVVVVAPLSGWLADRISTAWLCAVGGAMMAAGLLLIGLLPTDSAGMVFVIGTVLAGAGFGLFQTPNNRVLLMTAPKARSGAAGAMQGTARLFGQNLGAISMSIIFAATPLLAAPRVALVVSGLCAVLAGTISLGRVRHDRQP